MTPIPRPIDTGIYLPPRAGADPMYAVHPRSNGLPPAVVSELPSAETGPPRSKPCGWGAER
jgi:hypothetical protein